MNKPAYFYGYRIVVAAFIIQAVGIGIVSAFGIFFQPLLADFEWPRAVLSLAQSLALLTSGFLCILVGRLNDRFGPRVVMSFGAVFLGLGIILMSTLGHLWQLFLFYSVIFGIGLSTVEITPLSATTRWFVRKRGVMTGIVKVGTGTGQVIIPLTASLLIVSYGWQTSYVVIGSVATVLLMFAAQFLRRDPAQMKLVADGGSRLQTQNNKAVETGFYIRDALRNRQFWVVCFTFLATMFCLLTIIVHIVPHAIDIGISSAAAAGILSTIGGTSIVGRLLTGAAIDRIGNKMAMIICLSLLILTLLWLQLAQELWMLYLFTVVYGLSHGGLYTVVSPIVAEYFGTRSHGALFGIVFCCSMIGGAIGPVITGYIFDITGSYNLAFWICPAMSTLALALISTLRKPKKA